MNKKNQKPNETVGASHVAHQRLVRHWCNHIDRKENLEDWSWTDGKGWIFWSVSSDHPLYDWVIPNSWKCCPICGAIRPKVPNEKLKDRTVENQKP